jgi:hypothetical protein
MSVCTGGRLSYQHWLDGYIRRWVYAYESWWRYSISTVPVFIISARQYRWALWSTDWTSPWWDAYGGEPRGAVSGVSRESVHEKNNGHYSPGTGGVRTDGLHVTLTLEGSIGTAEVALRCHFDPERNCSGDVALKAGNSAQVLATAAIRGRCFQSIPQRVAL